MSLVRAGDRVRLMCNRDERHDRPQAFAPVVARAGRHLALHPVDPQGGGTWIAATGAGLAFALLNGEGPAVAHAPSRGRIVLDLLGCESLDAVAAKTRVLGRRRWSPFRLLATDGVTLLDILHGTGRSSVREYALGAAMMVTSSSLGAAAVGPCREALFEGLVGGPARDRFDGQDAFHRHRWPDRPDLSVHMRRHDAATQSITTVDLTPRTVTMRYESTTDVVGEPAMLAIERRASTSATSDVLTKAGRAAPVASFAVAS